MTMNSSPAHSDGNLTTTGAPALTCENTPCGDPSHTGPLSENARATSLGVENTQTPDEATQLARFRALLWADSAADLFDVSDRTAFSTLLDLVTETTTDPDLLKALAEFRTVVNDHAAHSD
jgi:hypothetical protein